MKRLTIYFSLLAVFLLAGCNFWDFFCPQGVVNGIGQDKLTIKFIGGSNYDNFTYNINYYGGDCGNDGQNLYTTVNGKWLEAELDGTYTKFTLDGSDLYTSPEMYADSDTWVQFLRQGVYARAPVGVPDFYNTDLSNKCYYFLKPSDWGEPLYIVAGNYYSGYFSKSTETSMSSIDGDWYYAYLYGYYNNAVMISNGTQTMIFTNYSGPSSWIVTYSTWTSTTSRPFSDYDSSVTLDVPNGSFESAMDNWSVQAAYGYAYSATNMYPSAYDGQYMCIFYLSNYSPVSVIQDTSASIPVNNSTDVFHLSLKYINPNGVKIKASIQWLNSNHDVIETHDGDTLKGSVGSWYRYDFYDYAPGFAAYMKIVITVDNPFNCACYFYVDGIKAEELTYN